MATSGNGTESWRNRCRHVVTQAQIYSMAIYLIDRYGADDAHAVARRKAAGAAAWQNLASIGVWTRIQAALEELIPERPPTIH